MNSVDYEERYRNLRNTLCIAFAVAWVIGWFLYANSGADPNAGLISAAIHSSNVGLAVLVAIVTVPIPMLIGRALARAHVRNQETADQNRNAAAQEAQRQEDERQRKMRLAAAEAAAQSGKQAIDRSTMVRKLGAVSNLLDLLPQETATDRIGTIKVGVAQELREVTANHTTEALEAMIRADEAVRLSLATVLPRLKAAGLDHSPEAVVIQTAAARAGVTPG